jgi:transcriptional regulator
MEEQQKILQLHCKKHIKIFKLKQAGLKNKEIADLLGTNAGHVYNALKKYNGNEELIAKAEAIQ